MPLDNIDFPDPAATPFLDDNGYTWDWVSTSWVRRTKNTVNEAPQDTKVYGRVDADWEEVTPIDPAGAGVLYVRKDGAWYEVIDVGSGITDAASDGTAYLRKDAAWVNPVVADFPDFVSELATKSDVGHAHVLADISDAGALAALNDAPVDGSQYMRKDGVWSPYVPGVDLHMSQGVSIINPQDTDDATLFYTTKAITLQNVAAHIVGTTNVVCNIYFAPTRNGAGTKVFTSDVTVTSEAGVTPTMNTTGIPINSWVWLEVVSVADTPEMFHLTLNYTQG